MALKAIFLRTISNTHHLLLLLERTIWNKFIPAVTGCHICHNKESVLIPLSIRYGGLAIHIFHKTAEIEFINSSKITSELTAHDIIEYNLTQNWDKKSIRRKIQKRNQKINNRNKWQRKTSCGYISSNWSFKLVNSTSNYRIWIWIIHAAILGFNDMVGKTCNIPTSCSCDSKFNIQHSMSYKKGGIICIRHNDLQDQTANIMSEVSEDMEAEAKLKPLSG